jgi:hypothetical protein
MLSQPLTQGSGCETCKAASYNQQCRHLRLLLLLLPLETLHVDLGLLPHCSAIALRVFAATRASACRTAALYPATAAELALPRCCTTALPFLEAGDTAQFIRLEVK